MIESLLESVGERLGVGRCKVCERYSRLVTNPHQRGDEPVMCPRCRQALDESVEILRREIDD